MFLSILRNTLDFFFGGKPASTVFFCAHVFVAALLQQTLLTKSPSCLASFLLTAAASNEWCSKSSTDFKSDPLNLATHCLLWACYRGVASLQPAVASTHLSDHPPHPSPPQVSSCRWAELATHRMSCSSHWLARAGVPRCTKEVLRFYCQKKKCLIFGAYHSSPPLHWIRQPVPGQA